jgi:hypothetical protein
MRCPAVASWLVAHFGYKVDERRVWPRAGWQRGRSSSPGRIKNFLFSTSSRSVLGPTQPPIQWEPGVKLPGPEGDHSPRTSTEVKKTWIYTSTPPYAFMVYKHKGNLTFTLHISLKATHIWGLSLTVLSPFVRSNTGWHRSSTPVLNLVVSCLRLLPECLWEVWTVYSLCWSPVWTLFSKQRTRLFAVINGRSGTDN